MPISILIACDLNGPPSQTLGQPTHFAVNLAFDATPSGQAVTISDPSGLIDCSAFPLSVSDNPHVVGLSTLAAVSPQRQITLTFTSGGVDLDVLVEAGS